MVKSKSRLAVKLFIVVWVVLAVHIVLKLTFNYWQPYVISSDRLQAISDFIDNNRWIQTTLNGILYMISALLMILCSIKRWWFKSKKQTIIVISLIIFCFIFGLIFKNTTINTLFLTIVLPLILDKKKWLYMILTFILNNIFLLLSLWLEGFTTANDMTYIIRFLLNNDYYIMLVLNYFVFNLFKKEQINNGRKFCFILVW
jgi:hypothetical protein